MRRLAIAAALTALLAVPAAARAAPPANDAPAGATEFEAYTAPNGAPQERQASAELAEAAADPGVPRCLGPDSFARTVWYRVPASGGPRLLRVEGTGGEGDGTAAPDLALFVQPGPDGPPAVAEPQACDGTGAGGAAAVGSDLAAAVEARVPAGRAMLVQVGRPGAQPPTSVQLSLREQPLEALPAPAGDEAGFAPGQALGAPDTVALGGATLTSEDPAQPACPAAGTVWRRFTAAGTGRHVATASGPAAGTLTAFVGAAPTADGAVGCENQVTPAGVLTVPFDAPAGAAIWLRVGSDAPARDAAARLGLTGPAGAGGSGGGPGPRGRIRITLVSSRSARRARKRAVRVRLRTTGRAFRSVRISFQRRIRRGRYRTVTRSTRITRLRVGTRTVRLRRARGRAGRLRAGRYRVRIIARTTTSPSRRYVVNKSYRLRR